MTHIYLLFLLINIYLFLFILSLLENIGVIENNLQCHQEADAEYGPGAGCGLYLAD
ncbi:hypothetical protein R0382_003578 [Jeongeupia wiesaeckerbachi]|uniref:hypothetical protein n=1 Tax=Jeongeupia wiesaeckerbachi TaxID=3051218 RepID=UPI003D8006DA